MAAEGETSNNAILRSLLELAAGGEEGAQQQLAASGGVSSENVAQLLAAAIAQVGQTILAGSSQPQGGGGSEREGGAEEEASQQTTSSSTENLPVNPLTAIPDASGNGGVFDLREAYESVPQASTLDNVVPDDTDVVSTVEIAAASEKPRPLCVKFPLELRRRIISTRKSGKLCKDIAKELKVSVSGVQKVWERFLATGMAHDRKPSTYAGRPRKSTYSQEVYSPGLDLPTSDDVFPSSHLDYVATPTSAPPTMGGVPPNGDVIITDESEVFTEGATVEIVETTPLLTPQSKSPRRKGAPAYRGRLLLKLVEGCPLASLRAGPESVANVHVQNLMVSITKPLYMEYVLGHPFGKVPPPRPFEGCTSTEAEVVLTDPANPVGKNLLAALGYSTKVHFNACCKPSPLFDPERLLTSLPLSLGPAHLADAMRNVIQLLIDFCVIPEEALNRLPTAAGPLIVAKRGEAILASHSIPTPAKLSEFWTQLYSHINLLQCCENFVSAHPPSAPCLLCHPFEHFAQSLEILEPEEAIPSLLPFSHSHLTSDLTSPEVEVQVLESGTSGLTSDLPLQRSLRGRGKGRRQSKSNEKQPQLPYSVYEEQDVVSDGEYEIPLVSEHPGSEVVVSHSSFVGMESGLETAEQVEASEAAQNLALLATQVTTMAAPSLTISLPHSSSNHHQPLEVAEVAVPLATTCTFSDHSSTVVTVSSSQPPPPPPPTSSQPVEQNVSSEIVAVAEVESSLHETDSTLTGNISASYNLAEVSIVGVGTQTGDREGTRDKPEPTRETVSSPAASKMTPESLRRSRRKITRVRRLVSEETPSHSPSEQDRAPENDTHTLSQRITVHTDHIVVLEDIRHTTKQVPSAAKQVSSTNLGLDNDFSLPPAKRTRSRALVRSEGDEEGVACVSGWSHPAEWGVVEVGEFISSIPHCSQYKDVFIEHLVDGETLLTLEPQMMVKLMDLKTGPALRIHRKILSLKKHFFL